MQATIATGLSNTNKVDAKEIYTVIATASPRATVAVSNFRDQPLADEVETVVRPLAFYHPRLEANWTDDQLQRLDNLRNEFAEALGGWNQNPWDPRYRELWIQAQPLIDEQFEAIFGVEAFNDQRIQAVHQEE